MKCALADACCQERCVFSDRSPRLLARRESENDKVFMALHPFTGQCFPGGDDQKSKIVLLDSVTHFLDVSSDPPTALSTSSSGVRTCRPVPDIGYLVQVHIRTPINWLSNKMSRDTDVQLGVSFVPFDDTHIQFEAIM